jgi:hypothetical protein
MAEIRQRILVKKSFWDDELSSHWSRNPVINLTESRFESLFSKVWFRAFSPFNIMAGFLTMGIYSFVSAILDEAFAPSVERGTIR